MRLLRKVGMVRVLASLLLLSLLPTLLAPTVLMARHTAALPYASWLRVQVQHPDEQAFEEALAAAEATRPASLRAFLEAFFAAYDAEAGADATQLFATYYGSKYYGSKEALITYLQGRFGQIVGDALLPRTMVLSARVLPNLTPERTVESGLVRTLQGVPPVYYSTSALAHLLERAQPAVRMLSAAQPLGP